MLFSHFRTSLALLCASSALLLLASISAASVVTEPAGFTTTSCLSNSDTLVTIPFTRPQAFVGSVVSVSGGTVTVSGSPGWTTNQFVYAQGSQSNHYYALIGAAAVANPKEAAVANPKEGHAYPITANSSSSFTVDTTNDSLTGVPANAQVVIIPYWTLATVFPRG